jgi:hypothetical protein
MLVKIQYRRGTASEWLDANPILALGEPGLDTSVMLTKIGDGVTHWEDLEFDEGGGSGPVTYMDLPDGVIVCLYFSTETGWPTRPFDRTDLIVMWIDTIGTGGVPPTSVAGVDIVVANASED